MKRIKIIVTVLLFAICSILIPSAPASASFNKDLIMDDVVFEDSNSMSAASIDSWLNGHANSCIKPASGFRTPDPQGWSPSQNKYLFGGNVTAGQAIYDTAQFYHVNPQVILATLQKEQSIVTGSAGCYYNSPDPASATPMTNACGSGTRNCTLACTHAGGCMNIALGYGCPNYCEAKDEGFSMQITLGTWLLRFGQQRSLGHLTGYVGYEAGDEYFTYSGPMTPGVRQRVAGGASLSYDGSYTTVNGVGVSIGSGATAALYNFTPFTSGNTSFVNIFEGWFGGTISNNYYSCHGATNIAGAPSGAKVIGYNVTGGFDNLTLEQLNNTGSACAEFHTWADSGYQKWSQHVASNLPSISPNDSEVISADLAGSGKDTLFLIQYRNTGSGKVEVHGWDQTLQRWTAHVATNLPAVDPADNRVIVADTNGDGKDEFIQVKYRNTGSGKVELHGFSGDLQGWVSHIATNLPAVDPADTDILAAHMTNKTDTIYLVQYRNTGSGKVEVHGWNGNMQGWVSHIATNLPAVDPADNKVIAADITGDGKDEFMLIKYRNTGSGKVEIHSWASNNFQWWILHSATSQPQY